MNEKIKSRLKPGEKLARRTRWEWVKKKEFADRKGFNSAWFDQRIIDVGEVKNIAVNAAAQSTRESNPRLIPAYIHGVHPNPVELITKKRWEEIEKKAAELKLQRDKMKPVEPEPDIIKVESEPEEVVAVEEKPKRKRGVRRGKKAKK